MAVTQTDISEIQAKIAPLIGQKAWGASLGIGSFITLEFGTPVAPKGNQGRTHGEWHLWVYYCAWRLEEDNKVLAGSEDPRPKLQAAVKRMEGLALQSVAIYPPALETMLTFEEEVVLRLFPIYTEEYEHWMLYMPDGNVLMIGPGTSWSSQKASTIPT